MQIQNHHSPQSESLKSCLLLIVTNFIQVEQVFDFASCQRYALKTVNLTNQAPAAIEAFKKEIDMLRKLQFSDKIIKLID